MTNSLSRLALGVLAALMFSSHAFATPTHTFALVGEAVHRVNEFSIFPISSATKNTLRAIRDEVAAKAEEYIEVHAGANVRLCKDRVQITRFSAQSYTMTFHCNEANRPASQGWIQGYCSYVDGLTINEVDHKSINCRNLRFSGRPAFSSLSIEERWRLRDLMSRAERQITDVMESIVYHWR